MVVSEGSSRRIEPAAIDEVATKAVVSILSGYAGRYVKDEEFREEIEEKCRACLARKKRDSDNGVLETLESGVENVNKLVLNPVFSTKAMRKCIENLSRVVASLDANKSKMNASTCGIPNSNLSACAQLYLAIVHKIERNDLVSAKHLLQVFCDSPSLARTHLLPHLWEHLFLPHLLHLKIWYSQEIEALTTTHFPTSPFSFLYTMVLAKEDSLVYGFKLSSVGSGKITPADTVHVPSGMDLAMKLHYLRGVYFFSSEAAEGLSVLKIKETMFVWLIEHWRVLGRFRRSESSGRPFVKCNDCGARFIEAQSDKTLEEWLGMDSSIHKLLASNQIIGPELFFSPPVLFQWTRLKCGGVSIGLSWSHILGDAMATSEYFFNGLSRTMTGKEPSPYPETSKPNIQKLKHPSPLALKKVDSVGDHWITPNNHKMETFSLVLTPTQLNSLELKLLGQNPNPAEEIPTFELICGVIWQCVAKVRQGSEPKLVTICTKGTKPAVAECGNNQIISTVEAADVADMDPKSLAAMLAKRESYEETQIGELVESENGASDYIVYGANLTFVNWEDADFYGFEAEGYKPVCVNYSIQGVGDEGAVLVQPGPNGEGRLVNVIFPEKEVLGLKAELRKNDLMLEINN